MAPFIGLALSRPVAAALDCRAQDGASSPPRSPLWSVKGPLRVRALARRRLALGSRPAARTGLVDLGLSARERGRAPGPAGRPQAHPPAHIVRNNY